MKKPILFLAIAAALTFTSCGNDDDGADKSCETCDVQGEELEICENSDGSLTVTQGGQSQTVSEEELGGLSVADYQALICSLGGLGDFGN